MSTTYNTMENLRNCGRKSFYYRTRIQSNYLHISIASIQKYSGNIRIKRFDKNNKTIWYADELKVTRPGISYILIKQI